MVIPNIFSINMEAQSKDANIYTSFEPYLFGVLGVSREDFMKDKNLRRTYQQKFAIIKSKFQAEVGSKRAITDIDCHNRIRSFTREWQDIITIAIENTADNGQEFIRTTPLDRYILMTNDEKRDLESRLNTAAIERVRSMFLGDNGNTSSRELEAMFQNNNSKQSDEKSRKM